MLKQKQGVTIREQKVNVLNPMKGGQVCLLLLTWLLHYISIHTEKSTICCII